jgi:predicted  nucleic acid-binding Zn-ribbon protein
MNQTEKERLIRAFGIISRRIDSLESEISKVKQAEVKLKAEIRSLRSTIENFLRVNVN